MSHSEAFTPHGSSSDDLGFSSDVGYTYQRADGTIEYATDAQDAIARCPVLGKLAIDAPEQVDILLELASMGQDILNEKEKNDLLQQDMEPLQENTKKTKSRDEVYEPDDILENDLNAEDRDFDDGKDYDDVEDVSVKIEAVESSATDTEDENYAYEEEYVEAMQVEPEPTVELDSKYEDLNDEQIQVVESGEVELEDVLNDTEELEDFVVQPALEQTPEPPALAVPAVQEAVGQVADEVFEFQAANQVIYQEPEGAIIQTKNVSDPTPKLAAPEVQYEAEVLTVDSITPPEPAHVVPADVQLESQENFEPPVSEVSQDLLVAPSTMEEVKAELPIDIDTNHAETVLKTDGSIAGSHKLPLAFYQESSQFESITKTKNESAVVNVEVASPPVPLRELNFQPFETVFEGQKKVVTLAEVKQGVEGKSFEHTVVEAVKFMAIKEDSPEKQQLHEIVSQLRLSLSSAETTTEEGRQELVMTPEIYENTLTLLRFLGHEEPELLVEQFTQTHGEDFLLDTLDYISGLDEVGKDEEIYADADTITTYNKLLALTVEQPKQEAEFIPESETEIPHEGVDTQVLQLINSQQETESDEAGAHLGSVGSLRPVQEKSEAEEFSIQIEPVQLHCDEEMTIKFETIDEPENSNFALENVVLLPMSLETIQEHAEEQPLEQTLAQVAMHMPEIAKTQSEALREVVADIKVLLTESYKKEDENTQREDELSYELREKTLELVKLLGYSKPEEVVEKCVTEYGSVFLLKALSFVCEPEDAFKRKTLELSIFTAGSSRKYKPSMEVSVGMTSKYIYLPAA